jgi:hypothetical protein
MSVGILVFWTIRSTSAHHPGLSWTVPSNTAKPQRSSTRNDFSRSDSLGQRFSCPTITGLSPQRRTCSAIWKIRSPPDLYEPPTKTKSSLATIASQSSGKFSAKRGSYAGSSSSTAASAAISSGSRSGNCFARQVSSPRNRGGIRNSCRSARAARCRRGCRYVRTSSANAALKCAHH